MLHIFRQKFNHKLHLRFEEVYVNAKVKDGSEVSELMEVFVDDAAYNSKFPVTSGSEVVPTDEEKIKYKL